MYPLHISTSRLRHCTNQLDQRSKAQEGRLLVGLAWVGLANVCRQILVYLLHAIVAALEDSLTFSDCDSQGSATLHKWATITES